MTTTFQSREAVRDALVTRFTTANNWQAVYGYFPPVKTWVGQSPILIIRGRGSSQEFAGEENNPTQYRLMLSSWVLASSEDGTITTQNAEDTLDTLDQAVRQVIRNYAGGDSVADYYYFEPGFSDVRDVIIEGRPYIVETRTVIAELCTGSL